MRSRSSRGIASAAAGRSPSLGLLVSANPAAAADVTVTGAGSTWSQIAVDQWRADVASQSGLRINFSGVGSSAGRQFYLISQVDFAVSEIPFQPDEVAKLRASNRSWQYLPIVAGGTALMYNLKDASGRQIRDLRLSASTIAESSPGASRTGRMRSPPTMVVRCQLRRSSRGSFRWIRDLGSVLGLPRPDQRQ